MGQFGNAASKAAGMLRAGSLKDPAAAWDRAVSEVTESDSCRTKRCPKTAFLVLCSDGKVRGVPSGIYVPGGAPRYALNGASALAADASLEKLSPSALWEVVRPPRGPRAENGRMDVVLGLYRSGLLW